MQQVGAATTQNTQAPSGIELGTGVNLVATEKVYTQGNLNQTGNALDWRSTASGFFQVLMPDGTLPTRAMAAFRPAPPGSS